MSYSKNQKRLQQGIGVVTKASQALAAEKIKKLKNNDYLFLLYTTKGVMCKRISKMFNRYKKKSCFSGMATQKILSLQKIILCFAGLFFLPVKHPLWHA